MPTIPDRRIVISAHNHAFNLILQGKVAEAKSVLAHIPSHAGETKPAPSVSLDCTHRGSEIIRQETADLCGFRGQLFDVFSCQKWGECSLHRYCQRQTVRTCFSCIAAGENS